MYYSKAQSSSNYTICILLASILLNIFLITNVFNIVGGGTWKLLSWSQRAAAEAEAVAAESCSGHGRAYLDGLLQVDGKPVCECNTCFQGPQCSEFIPDCVVDADSGDPLFLEPFWKQHAESSAVLAAGWHRMSYTFSDGTYISQSLEGLIRKLHQVAKNAITDGKYIIFGAGSTQLLNAAVFAFAMDNTSSTAKVVASAPYYSFYETQTDFFANERFKFAGDASLFKNSSDNLIEFVTAPNNPDGYMNKPVLQGPSVSTIYDHAYYWPHYTAIPAPFDEDLMVFTISKLTGHAGSRFGWAVIKDVDIYKKMSLYLDNASLGISRDTQLRVFQLLRSVLEDDGSDLFNFAYEKMNVRWHNLTRILSLSKRFSLQEISTEYCNYFQKTRAATPAYAWLKCEKEEDTDCYQVLQAAKITGRKGPLFNADRRYVRLSLLKGDDDFDMLLYRLNQLVSMEDAAETALQRL